MFANLVFNFVSLAPWQIFDQYSSTVQSFSFTGRSRFQAIVEPHQVGKKKVSSYGKQPSDPTPLFLYSVEKTGLHKCGQTTLNPKEHLVWLHKLLNNWPNIYQDFKTLAFKMKAIAVRYPEHENCVRNTNLNGLNCSAVSVIQRKKTWVDLNVSAEIWVDQKRLFSLCSQTAKQIL